MCNWGGQVLQPALIWEAKMYSCSILLVGVNWNPVPSGVAVVKNRVANFAKVPCSISPSYICNYGHNEMSA